MRRRWFVMGPVALLLMALFAVIGGEVVQQLWNWLMPLILGVRQLTFWQALGLLALCRILFGRIGGRGFRRAGTWTPEEKQRFRQAILDRWGASHPTSAPGNPAGGATS